MQPSRFKVVTDFQKLVCIGTIKGERIYGEIIQWICHLKYRNCLADKATCWGLMVAPDLWFCTLFSLPLTNWILGMGRSLGPIVSWPFGAVHYAWGWGKVSMWPFRRVLQLLKERNSLIARCSPLRINVPRGTWLRHKKSRITHATASLGGRILVCPHLRLSAHLNQWLLGLPGSDSAAPHRASHASDSDTHYQCVRRLQHPSRASDRTGPGHLQTGEVCFGPQGTWSEKEGELVWFIFLTKVFNFLLSLLKVSFSFFLYKMYLERNVKYFHFPSQMDKAFVTF